MVSRKMLVVSISALLLLYSAFMAIPLTAGTVSIAWSGAGVAPAGTPVVTATTLSFTSTATGSLTQWNPAVNALWNPVGFQGQDVVNLNTGIDNASITLTFADGDTLTGNLVGNVSAILASPTGLERLKKRGRSREALASSRPLPESLTSRRSPKRIVTILRPPAGAR